MNKRLIDATSLVVLILAITGQSIICANTLKRYEETVPKTFSLQWAEESINENKQDPAYPTNMQYLQVASLNDKSPEYEYLVQRFKHEQLVKMIEFENQKKNLLFAALGTLLWDLGGLLITLTRSSSYLNYGLKLVACILVFYIPATVNVLIGPALVLWFSVWDAIARGQSGRF
ncbi:MAG: hypothetical protein AB7W16_14515 [Candidatus Obscuribacterales bacterium]